MRYYLLKRSHHKRFEESLNKYVKEGWIYLPHSYKSFYRDSLGMEYNCMLYKPTD